MATGEVRQGTAWRLGNADWRSILFTTLVVLFVGSTARAAEPGPDADTLGVADGVADTREPAAPDNDFSVKDLLKRGDRTLWLGIAGAGNPALPSGMDYACDSGWFLTCGIGGRLGIDVREPRSGPGLRLTRLVLDGQDYSQFSFTSLLASRGLSSEVNYDRLIGIGAEATLGAGITHVTVNGDGAFTPSVEIGVAASAYISRVVVSLGINLRHIVSTRVDGHSYQSTSRGGHFSIGFTF